MHAKDSHVPGLRYVTDDSPGIKRRRAGRGFVYIGPNGKRIKNREELDRIRALAIPPAWEDVWICPYPTGHILATGRDAKGRKQYKYHPRWRKVRDGSKFEKTIAFGESLPSLRRRLRHDMALTGMPKEKVVATVVALLDCCFARVGNEEYTKSNGSFGLTTLRNRHARFKGSELRLRYKGKGGKEHEAVVDDRRIVYIVRKCQEIPGQELFQYIDEEGERNAIGSSDVNDYLREVTGEDFSAKDFRTWAGTVTAVGELARTAPAKSERGRQKHILAAIDSVAESLGNTRAIARSSYVHPFAIEGYEDGSLARAWERIRSGNSSSRGLNADERFTLQFLKSRARSAKRAA